MIFSCHSYCIIYIWIAFKLFQAWFYRLNPFRLAIYKKCILELLLSAKKAKSSPHQWHPSRCWRCIIHLNQIFLRFPFQCLKHAKHVESKLRKLNLVRTRANNQHFLQGQSHHWRFLYWRSNQRIQSENRYQNNR